MSEWVYRPPWPYAPQNAVQYWHQQPLWAIEGGLAIVQYTANVGAIAFYPTIAGGTQALGYTTYSAIIGSNYNIAGGTDLLVYTANAATLGLHRVIAGSTVSVAYTTYAGTVSSEERAYSTVAGIVGMPAQKSITALTGQKSITLQRAA